MVKIVAFAGSLRKGSFNKKLINLASKAAEEAGAEVALVDLSDLDIPLYNEDLEKSKGIPSDAKDLKELLLESDAIMISSPEYNSSVTAVLKNVIDWVSRPEDSDPCRLAAYQGKVVAIMSASPGALGGIRGLVHLRSILGNIGCLVLPDQVCVKKADEAFDDGGDLKDETVRNNLFSLVEKLVETTGLLSQNRAKA